MTEYRTLLAAVAAIIANSVLAYLHPEQHTDVVEWNTAIVGFVAGRAILKEGAIGAALSAFTKDADKTDPGVARRTPRSP